MEFTYTVPNGRNHAPLQLYAVQGEAGARTFTLNLTGGGAVDGAAYVYVLKNDGTLVVINAGGSSGSVTFTLPLQACTCPGNNKVYIQVIGGQTEIRWDNIELWVQPCDLEDAVASTDDLGPLADIITDPDYLEEIQNAYITAKNNLDSLMEQFSPKGEYNPSTAYKALNIVSQNGSSYVAIQDTQGNPPTNTTYWQLLAAKGKQGDPGEHGQKGDPGEPGKGLELGDVGGPYDSREALESAVPAPEEGSSYFVGTAAPYDLYRYREGGWQNLGPLQGAPGPAGATPEFKVGEVATLEPGSEATATLSGTAEQPVLNFGIPRGADGAPGQGGVTLQQVIDVVYPVGAVHITTANVNPGAYLSGTTWEAFGSGKTLVGVDTTDDEFNTVEKTGGQKEYVYTHAHTISSHTLTVQEIPSHTHDMTHGHSDDFSVASNGSHTHSFSDTSTAAGASGTARILGYDSKSASGDLSLSDNSMILAYPASGKSWGYTTLNLNDSHTHRVSGATGSSGAHIHTLSGGVDNWSGDTNPEGGGGGHTHTAENRSLTTPLLQPYITCYFWKRVS